MMAHLALGCRVDGKSERPGAIATATTARSFVRSLARGGGGGRRRTGSQRQPDSHISARPAWMPTDRHDCDAHEFGAAADETGIAAVSAAATAQMIARDRRDDKTDER